MTLSGHISPSEREFDLATFVKMCREGIDAEIRANKETLSNAGLAKGVPVFAGEPVDHVDIGEEKEFLYSFRYKHALTHDDVPIELPTGSACAFQSGGIRANGKIREHDGGRKRLVVALNVAIGDETGNGTLFFDVAFLLENLREHIAESARRGLTDLDAFTHGRWYGEPVANEKLPVAIHNLTLNDAQFDVVRRCCGDGWHLVWGPPGTGKTTTLGAAVLARILASPSSRVIVLAHTNVALDNAIHAIWRAYNGAVSESRKRFRDEVKLYRIGRAESDDVRDHADALYDELLRRDEVVVWALRVLEAELGGRGTTMRSRIAHVLRTVRIREEQGGCPKDVLDAAKRLEEQLVEVDQHVLAKCRVLCCTASQFDIKRSELTRLSWDSVFLDEASTVGFARAMTVAALGLPTFFFGDFRQLPPIVRSHERAAQMVLFNNVFNWIGADDPAVEDPRRSMLNLQYRMRPEICEPISNLFYGQRLKTAPERANEFSKFHHGVLGVYTENLRAVAEVSGKSKVNEVHLRLVAMLVHALRKHGFDDIGVIAPYAAQVERIKQELKRLPVQASTSLATVEISTVHRYQGRERQIIIFDSMLSAGEKMGFLYERTNPSIANLANVALSRAREALFVLLDEEAARQLWPKQDIYAKSMTRIVAGDEEFEFAPTTLKLADVEAFVTRQLRSGDALF